eukprot:UN17838
MTYGFATSPHNRLKWKSSSTKGLKKAPGVHQTSKNNLQNTAVQLSRRKF